MEVQIVSSTANDSGGEQFLMSLIVAGELAIDAGCIGLASPLEIQTRIKHVLLTHSHMDHIASLPLLLDNVFALGQDCPTVYGSREVIQTLRTDLFNGRVWPDLVALTDGGTEFLRLHELQAGRELTLGDFRVIPVQLHHAVPTLGFLIDDGDTAVAFVADTAPTEEIWRVANQASRLKAVFIESSFPSRLGWLAEETKHLTPTLVDAELRKLDVPARVVAVHIKPAFRSEVEQELLSLGLSNLEIGVPGQVYEF